MKNQRLEFIDIAKGIGILCVVGGHLLDEGEISFVGSKLLRMAIYRFHIPLFFTISGMLLWNYYQNYGYTLKNTIFKIKKIISSLLVPYSTWSMIYFIISDTNRTQSIVTWLPYIITLRGMAPLWFLAALFLSELSLFIIIVFVKKNWHTIISLILLVALSIIFSNAKNKIQYNNVWGEFIYITIGRNFVSMFFVLLGWILAKYLIEIKKVKLLFVMFLCSILVLSTSIYEAGEVNFHLFSLGNSFLFLEYQAQFL